MNRTEILFEKELTECVSWLVSLRWLAGGAVISLALAAQMLWPQHAAPVWSLGGAILLCNACIQFKLQRIPPRLSIHLQITLDWAVLAVLCHFTGGTHSPFIFFYLVHVILAAIYMGQADSIAQGLSAVLMLTCTSLLEYVGVLSNHPMPFLPPTRFPESPLNLLVSLGSFSAVILFSTYIPSSVVRKKREAQAQQIELQERLKRAYDELLEQDKKNSEFVRVAAHEIRGPLSAIQSMLKVVMEGYAGAMDPKVGELVGRSEGRIVQLICMVNELLDLVRGKQGPQQENLKDVKMDVLLAKLLRDMEARAKEKGLRLTLKVRWEGLTVRGDPQDFERVFQNLLANAINYTPPGGRVEVLADLLPSSEVVVRVSDTGIGIPPTDLPRVFDEFFRAQNVKKAQTGSGLGLAIVKRTVERYFGRVEATSVPGEGTTFSVHLPAQTMPQ